MRHHRIELVEVLVEQPGVVHARLGRDGEGALLLGHRFRRLGHLDAFDMGAEGPEHLRGRAYRALDLGVHLVEEEGLGQGQPKPATPAPSRASTSCGRMPAVVSSRASTPCIA